MKRKGLSFNYIILTLICQFCLCLGLSNGSANAANVNNFYFKSFEADYFISKANDGAAKMRVVENLTAVFPDYNQNKGICREIPYLGQNGRKTLPSLTRSDITITRNGAREPIYSIERDTDGRFYRVCTGTEEYVTGTQVYTLEYNFYGVAVGYDNGQKAWQEIYWNTNGTGWSQRFDSLTARIHFEDPSVMTGETSCYVGSRGSKGTERCNTTSISDGFQFSTSGLKARENLTFDVELKPDVFAITPAEKSYVMYAVLGGVSVLCAWTLFIAIRRFRKTAEKRKFYKNYYIVPQYTPAKGFSIPEMSEIYINKKANADVKVAVLLDMIVRGKIEIVEDGAGFLGKKKWAIIPKVGKDELEDFELCILGILNGDTNFSVGEKIEIKRRSANSTLVSLGSRFDKNGSTSAKNDGLVEKTKKVLMPFYGTITLLIFVCVPLAFLLADSIMVNENGEAYSLEDGAILVNFIPIIIASIAIFVGSSIIKGILNSQSSKVINHTIKGLEMSRYMDGLKLYITMAEKDRLEFLQSVKGAPRDTTKIVKLNEKLLPYAALFGVEESWMKELSQYYILKDTGAPDWYSSISICGFATLNSTLRTASSYATSASHYSSSGSSGGGGGGFSGGGGGGGGGGGR